MISTTSNQGLREVLRPPRESRPKAWALRSRSAAAWPPRLCIKTRVLSWDAWSTFPPRHGPVLHVGGQRPDVTSEKLPDVTREKKRTCMALSAKTVVFRRRYRMMCLLILWRMLSFDGWWHLQIRLPLLSSCGVIATKMSHHSWPPAILPLKNARLVVAEAGKMQFRSHVRNVPVTTSTWDFATRSTISRKFTPRSWFTTTGGTHVLHHMCWSWPWLTPLLLPR